MIRRLAFRLSRVDRMPEYEAHRYFSCGLRIHSQHGHSTDTMVDLACLGGMLISRNRICPSVMAWRCSQIAWM